MKYLNGIKDPEIWDYNLDDDFIIENYGVFNNYLPILKF